MGQYLSWHWWDERCVEVPEPFHDWMAPRWYLVMVGLAYLTMAGLSGYGLFSLMKAL